MDIIDSLLVNFRMKYALLAEKEQILQDREQLLANKDEMLREREQLLKVKEMALTQRELELQRQEMILFPLKQLKLESLEISILLKKIPRVMTKLIMDIVIFGEMIRRRSELFAYIHADIESIYEFSDEHNGIAQYEMDINRNHVYERSITYSGPIHPNTDLCARTLTFQFCTNCDQMLYYQNMNHQPLAFLGCPYGCSGLFQ